MSLPLPNLLHDVVGLFQIRKKGATAINRDEGAFHLDHVYNPLLRKTIASLPGNDVNKFRRKSSGPDHLWSSHQTKMVKEAKVWLNFIGFVKHNLFYIFSYCVFTRYGSVIMHMNCQKPFHSLFMQSKYGNFWVYINHIIMNIPHCKVDHMHTKVWTSHNTLGVNLTPVLLQCTRLIPTRNIAKFNENLMKLTKT